MALEKAGELSFSVNLQEQVVHLLSFLESISSIRKLNESDVIARALYRYEHYWLPLAADHASECLSAPPDVQWVWYCHMSSPDVYIQDCMAVVHKIVNHTLVDQKQYKINQSISQNYWNQKYKSSSEPFYVFYGTPFYRSVSNKKPSKISCDIPKVAEFQRSFCLQVVSLVHFNDSIYITDSLLRYKKFLVLKSMFLDENLVPTLDIEIMRQAHKLNPVCFRQDTEKLYASNAVPENDAGSIASDHKLQKWYSETSTKWKITFGEVYLRFGSMQRVFPETEVIEISTMTEMDCYSVCTKETFVSMKRLVLRLPRHVTGDEFKKLQITAVACSGKEEMSTWFTQRKILDGAGTTRVEFRIPSEEFQFDTRMLNCMMFELERRLGGGCRAVMEYIGKGYYELMTPIESMSFMGGGTFSAKQNLTREITLDIHGSFSPPSKGPIWLQLKRGEFDNVLGVEDVGQACGLVGLNTPDSCEHCQVASHRLVNHAEKTAFTVNVYHLMPAMMSVVQVQHDNKTVATVHLISSEQLPLPNQVGTEVLSLDPREGERAAVIRNGIGDWAIVKAKWNQYKKPTKGTSGKRTLPLEAGTMAITVYKHSTGQTYTVNLANTDNQYSLLLEPMEADLIKGTAGIEESGISEVAENLALIFAVSLLHVLIVPRSRSWRAGQRVMPGFSDEELETESILFSDDMEFILAAGLLCNSPSNHYIRVHHGANAFTIYDRFSEVNNYVGDLTDYISKAEDDKKVKQP